MSEHDEWNTGQFGANALCEPLQVAHHPVPTVVAAPAEILVVAGRSPVATKIRRVHGVAAFGELAGETAIAQRVLGQSVRDDNRRARRPGGERAVHDEIDPVAAQREGRVRHGVHRVSDRLG